MKKKQEIDRRTFMGMITWAIGGLIGAGFGIPAIAYIISPASKKNETQDWIPLGSVSKVELGVPTLFKAKIERQTGWITDEEELSIYVFSENGRDFVAMSNICTHLGCRVRWIAEQDQFFCPCHNAGFKKNGDVASGPPPKPLDQYQVKEEDGQLFVLGG